MRAILNLVKSSAIYEYFLRINKEIRAIVFECVIGLFRVFDKSTRTDYCVVVLVSVLFKSGLLIVLRRHISF